MIPYLLLSSRETQTALRYAIPVTRDDPKTVSIMAKIWVRFQESMVKLFRT